MTLPCSHPRLPSQQNQSLRPSPHLPFCTSERPLPRHPLTHVRACSSYPLHFYSVVSLSSAAQQKSLRYPCPAEDISDTCATQTPLPPPPWAKSTSRERVVATPAPLHHRTHTPQTPERLCVHVAPHRPMFWEEHTEWFRRAREHISLPLPLPSFLRRRHLRPFGSHPTWLPSPVDLPLLHHHLYRHSFHHSLLLPPFPLPSSPPIPSSWPTS
mmetsp:Transcript_40794/g.85703  ORF Transcript_40794/g.85703 Transcript_40794/m.85703 type:complete len:213 (+) Transcript_40794:896-1534(+)